MLGGAWLDAAWLDTAWLRDVKFSAIRLCGTRRKPAGIRHQQQDVLKALLPKIPEDDAFCSETPAFPVLAGQAVVQRECFLKEDIGVIHRHLYVAATPVVPLHP